MTVIAFPGKPQPRNPWSEARKRMLTQPGHLYAVYSRYCDWIKIGFTLDIEKRRKAINRQYADFAPFSLIGSVRSTWAAEQQLHRCFAPFRHRRTASTAELYPAVPSLVQNVRALLTHREWPVMPAERATALRRYAFRVANDPLNELECRISFERFYEERASA